MKTKKPLLSKKLGLQLLVSGVLILFIFRKLDTSKLFRALSEVQLSTVVLLIAIYFLGQILSATKWRILVLNAELNRSWSECLRAYFLGMFFNAFGLGTVGGDVARAVALKPEKGQRAAAFATVVADRIHGLAVLVTIGAVGIAIEQPAVMDTLTGGYLRLPVLSWLAVAVLVICWFIGPKLLLQVASLFERIKQEKLASAATAVSKAFPTARPFLVATTISAIFHSSQIAIHMVMAKSLGVEISWGYLFAVIPIVNAASSMPVSIQGLGVREGAYLLLLPPAGIPNEICVAFGGLWFLTATASAALAALNVLPQLFRTKEEVSALQEGKQEDESYQEREIIGA